MPVRRINVFVNGVYVAKDVEIVLKNGCGKLDEKWGVYCGQGAGHWRCCFCWRHVCSECAAKSYIFANEHRFFGNPPQHLACLKERYDSVEKPREFGPLEIPPPPPGQYMN